MNYSCSYLKPDEPNSIENGVMDKESALKFFENYNWDEELRRMDKLPEDKVHYSPSIKFEDLQNQKWIELSAVGDAGNYEFYIFYKRSKEVKKLFGLLTKQDHHFVSDILDISPSKTKAILHHFFEKEWEKLENEF